MKKNALAMGENEIGITKQKVLVWIVFILIGVNLRAVILAVPPVLPLIQRDLGLSYTTIGLLTALPILVLGLAGWISGVVVERIGERTSVALGLALLGCAAMLRAWSPSTFTLILFTFLLSVGIALSQTAIPPLVRRWFPMQIGLVTALFSDGLIVGESLAAGLTLPIMVRYFGGDAWNATFIFWGIPVIVSLVLWLWLAPSIAGPRGSQHSKAVDYHATTPKSELPEKKASSARRSVSALHLGIMLGANSLIYFGMNSWIASYNQAIHASNLTPLVLAVLNTAQLPASLGVTFFAQRLAGRRWPFIVSGTVCALAIVGWASTPAALEFLWAMLLGGSSALVFTLGIALPPLLAKPTEVARLTGLTLSLTYGVAFVGPLVGGRLWDVFHLPLLAFLPVFVASLTLAILGVLLPARAAFEQKMV